MYNQLELKNNFNQIKGLRENVDNLLDGLTERVETLTNIYNDMLTRNLSQTKNDLDSFHFQTKLINIELSNSKNMSNIIQNRMYCDYYKLFKNVLKFLTENTKNKNTVAIYENKSYPIYKDLDILIPYDFDIIIELYNDILLMLEVLNDDLQNRENILKQQKIKRDTGLNIDNLINTYSFNNNNLRNRLDLFIQYLKIYNSFHSKYLTGFAIKTKLFYGQVNRDINIEESKNNVSPKIAKQSSDKGIVKFDEIIIQKDEEEDMKKMIYSNDKRRQTIIQKELDSMMSGLSHEEETEESENFENKNDLPNLSEISDNQESIKNLIKIQKKIREKNETKKKVELKINKFKNNNNEEVTIKENNNDYIIEDNNNIIERENKEMNKHSKYSDYELEYNFIDLKNSCNII